MSLVTQQKTKACLQVAAGACPFAELSFQSWHRRGGVCSWGARQARLCSRHCLVAGTQEHRLDFVSPPKGMG